MTLARNKSNESIGSKKSKHEHYLRKSMGRQERKRQDMRVSKNLRPLKPPRSLTLVNELR